MLTLSAVDFNVVHAMVSWRLYWNRPNRVFADVWPWHNDSEHVRKELGFLQQPAKKDEAACR